MTFTQTSGILLWRSKDSRWTRSVSPAEDINNIMDYMIVFVPLRPDAGVFFMSVIIRVEVKYTHAKRKGS